LIASGFTSEDVCERDLQDIANQLLLKGRSSDWHNALMDYGSAVLTSSLTGIEPVSKQPRFAGSRRKTRGLIVQMLTQTESLSVEDIQSQLSSEDLDCNDLSEILDQLVKDRLIERTKNEKYRISKS
jgi:A/G-specific adenine glycosylase